MLQLLNEVPDWAKNFGLNETSFDILESIAINPAKKDEILQHVEYGIACGILHAYEYAMDKGLV